MATFEVLDELMEITGSTKLHKRMRFWFVQEIAEEEGLLKFLCDRCDDLRRKNTRRRVLIREMEDSRENAIAESLAGIHEKERHVAKLDLMISLLHGSFALPEIVGPFLCGSLALHEIVEFHRAPHTKVLISITGSNSG
nr:hypothetical protein [Tanacetum cinerariifolium]